MITPEQALQNQEQIYSEAQYLLQKTQIIDTLSNYGSVELEGSYFYRLMIKRDVDIRVINPTITHDDVEDLLSKLSNTPGLITPEQVYTSTGDSRQGEPVGWYIKVKTKINDNDWKIDVWIMTDYSISTSSPESIRDNSWINKCTRGQKHAIILIKAQLFERNGDYTAANIYRAVLEGGAKDINDFDNWRKQNIDNVMQ